jgi:hypothetical protein
MKISARLDEFVERQGMVSAEFCKIIDDLETFEEAYQQLVNKIELLDLKRENAELKLKDSLKAYRKLKDSNE